MAKLIVVLGVTGNQGGAVARTFASEPGWRVRGITRDPSKPSTQSLKELGVSLVAGDLDDPASLERAFVGASAIFGVTDFWQFTADPACQEVAQKTGKPINEIAFDREVKQGKNLVDAAAKIAGNDEFERLVWSTLSDTKKWSKGKYLHNLHFDSKAMVDDYIKSQYPKLARKTSYLQMGLFLANWQRMGGATAPKKQQDGTFVISYPTVPPHKPLPWVHPPHDTGHFARALILEAPAGKTMLGTSGQLTDDEYAALWGKILGVKAIFKPMPRKIFEQMMPGPLGIERADTAEYQREFGYDGGDPDVSMPKDLGVKMENLLTPEEYIRTTDWSSVLC